ncbi:metallophosphoesterase family protein [Microvirga pudoricolor]|uniref:metallophosphoesterase family protein n=1 Tax=Microvirga pudoricolor TaxID=2778729 RepID=UPI00194FE03E|nr:metallophosphoesterase [Microvirga pudoricolor]MBM6594841.1 metallophosphoesterase [Microvirga pudoricolor]
MTQIAVLADVHLHDVYGDYGFAGVLNSRSGQAASVRTLRDTIRSTRAFNESYFAVQAVLDDLAAKGVRHVVLVGDYSDDGQRATVEGVARILARYRDLHGMAFYGTVGNHDTVQPFGSHQGKAFLGPDGSATLVTSDPQAAERTEGAVVSQAMRGLGYDESLSLLGEAGFQPQEAYLHWETPFGAGPRAFPMTAEDGSRTLEVPDASYLVEPVDGVWILSIDGNVFLPKADGGFTDASDAGWDALVKHKPGLLAWIRNVTDRARRQGKRLLAFSHYPLVDYMNGTSAEQERLYGRVGFIRRNPGDVTSRIGLDCGLSVHFSGHIHIDATGTVEAEGRRLTNIAVPSLAAYPPAYKLVTFTREAMQVETVHVDHVPRFDELFEHYRREGGRYGAILEADDYRSFLREHLTQLVLHRHLAEDWPDMQGLIARLNGLDLLRLACLGDTAPSAAGDALRAVPPAVEREVRERMSQAGIDARALEALRLEELVVDWYRLRNGGTLAFRDIAPGRRNMYGFLAEAFRLEGDPDSIQGRLGGLLRVMMRYLALPSSQRLEFPARADGRLHEAETTREEALRLQTIRA